MAKESDDGVRAGNTWYGKAPERDAIRYGSQIPIDAIEARKRKKWGWIAVAASAAIILLFFFWR